jgi:hypothetical protein
VESKYCPADLNKIATECHFLNADQQETLHKLLRKFAHLFDGTLGNWKTDPVDLELKDKNENLIMQEHIQSHTHKNNC